MARKTHGCWLRVSLGRGPQTFERNSRSGPHFAVFFFQGLVPLCSPICQSYLSLPKRRFYYPSRGCVHGTFDSSGKFLATLWKISSFYWYYWAFLAVLDSILFPFAPPFVRVISPCLKGGVITQAGAHCLGMNYYVNFLGGIDSNGFHIRFILGTQDNWIS